MAGAISSLIQPSVPSSVVASSNITSNRNTYIGRPTALTPAP